MDVAVYSTFAFTVVADGDGSIDSLPHIAMGLMSGHQGPGYNYDWAKMLGNLKRLAED